MYGIKFIMYLVLHTVKHFTKCSIGQSELATIEKIVNKGQKTYILEKFGHLNY